MTMSLEEQASGIIALLLAFLLSLLIGIDRERNNKAAGLRTHILAGLGACLFTLISVHAFASDSVAATVVTGIGFLGAGTIVSARGGTVSLTTAASIWATAAIGMAVGVGAWLLAISATLLIWFVLSVLYQLEQRYLHKQSLKDHASPTDAP